MKGLVQKILKGTYPPLPDMYSADLKKLISEMLIKDPNKRPSIRKILEMPFMKAKINDLFSNTLKTHELQLYKENTFKSDLVIKHESVKPGKSQEKNLSKEKADLENRGPKEKINMFKKKDEYRKDSRKIEIISKNQSEVGLQKKQ
jgi:serine/threonine protein kinase